MSIRLLTPVQIAGVHTAVDGATLYLSADLEAVLVGKQAAVYVDAPKQDNGRMFASYQKSALAGGALRQDPVILPTLWSAYSIGIPFVIPPGDGGSNGLSFSGSAGEFTLSAAILSSLGGMLPGCYLYLPANFGGLTIAADWYWTEFSSDTAGIVYSNTYTTGKPVAPTSKLPLSANASGRITTTTAEVTGPSGLTILGGSLGPNGGLQLLVNQSGSSSATAKTVRVYAGSEVVFLNRPTSSPHQANLTVLQNIGGTAKQNGYRGDSTTAGLATAGGTITAVSYSSVDTSASFDLSVSLQTASTAESCVLLSFNVFQFYGA